MVVFHIWIGRCCCCCVFFLFLLAMRLVLSVKRLSGFRMCQYSIKWFPETHSQYAISVCQCPSKPKCSCEYFPFLHYNVASALISVYSHNSLVVLCLFDLVQVNCLFISFSIFFSLSLGYLPKGNTEKYCNIFNTSKNRTHASKNALYVNSKLHTMQNFWNMFMQHRKNAWNFLRFQFFLFLSLYLFFECVMVCGIQYVAYFSAENIQNGEVCFWVHSNGSFFFFGELNVIQEEANLFSACIIESSVSILYCPFSWLHFPASQHFCFVCKMHRFFL